MTVSKLGTKARPTNHDLQKQVLEVHECLHKTDAKVEVIQLQLVAVAKALRVDLPTPEELAQGAQPHVKRRLGSLPPWQALAVAVPAIVGSLGLYKIMEPAVIAFFVALRHALLTVHP